MWSIALEGGGMTSGRMFENDSDMTSLGIGHSGVKEKWFLSLSL